MQKNIPQFLPAKILVGVFQQSKEDEESQQVDGRRTTSDGKKIQKATSFERRDSYMYLQVGKKTEVDLKVLCQ